VDYVDWGKFEGRKSFPEISFGMECRPDKEKPFFYWKNGVFSGFLVSSNPTLRVAYYHIPQLIWLKF
jgi:hypothetical protein